MLAVRLARWPRTWLCGMRTVLGHATTAVQRAGSWMLKRHACPQSGMDTLGPTATMLLLQTRARRARLIVRGGRQHHNSARRADERLRSASYWRPTTVSASRTFPQLHLLTPVFARDAAGERQSVRLGHHLIPPDGFVMAAAPQRAGSLVVPSPRALGGGERSGSGAARHLNVDLELYGVVFELSRVSCGSGEL